MDEKLKNLSNQAETKQKKQADEHNKKIKSLQLRVRNGDLKFEFQFFPVWQVKSSGIRQSKMKK